MQVIDSPTIENDGMRIVRRAYTVLSFLSHFYVHSHQQIDNTIIPKSLAIPWVQSSNLLGLPPILTYASTVLWNWKFKDIEKGLEIGNFTTPLTFTRTVDEEHFYLTSLNIELKGNQILNLMSKCLDEIFMYEISPKVSTRRLFENLNKISLIVKDLTEILINVRSDCKPSVFYNYIRKWFNGSNGNGGWIYEGVDNDNIKRDYGGPSAGQSTLIHAIDAFLSVNHAPADENADFDDTFMKRMQVYMPLHHREFLNHLLNLKLTLRDVVIHSSDEQLVASYNNCLKSMKVFRDEHIKIATLYIVTQSRATSNEGATTSQNSSNSNESQVKGTGGTSLVKFLKTCRDRTQESIL